MFCLPYLHAGSSRSVRNLRPNRAPEHETATLPGVACLKTVQYAAHMATKRARKRPQNPQNRGTVRQTSSTPVRDPEPVNYTDEPLPGLAPPVIGTPRGAVRVALAQRVMRLSDLENAAVAVEAAQLVLSEAVCSAREAGLSWADIGDALGLDRETARRRWSVSGR